MSNKGNKSNVSNKAGHKSKQPAPQPVQMTPERQKHSEAQSARAKLLKLGYEGWAAEERRMYEEKLAAASQRLQAALTKMRGSPTEEKAAINEQEVKPANKAYLDRLSLRHHIGTREEWDDLLGWWEWHIRELARQANRPA
jgi:hypothetical protein